MMSRQASAQHDPQAAQRGDHDINPHHSAPQHMLNIRPAAKTPAELWDWLTPQEIAATAVAALQTAQKAAQLEPTGEPDYVIDEFRNSFETYTSRANFVDDLIEIFTLHLNILAEEKGVETNQYWNIGPIEQLKKWTDK